MTNNPIATIEMDTGKTITIELYPDIAPQSVRNFIALANSGFYDGLIFHRCIYGFMIQGGCPDGTGMGGPGYCIRGEFASNGFPNDLRHTRGVLSMARAMAPDSAGSQFFIMHKDAPHLDGDYAAFGMVMDGMDHAEVVARLNAEYLELSARNDQLVTGFIKRNYDNVLGPGIFMIMTSGYSYPILTPQIEEILTSATPYFVNHPYVSAYVKVARETMEKMRQ